MQQRRRAHLPEDVEQPEDPLALRRAAAVQRRIDELQAQRLGGLTAQRIRAIAGLAAQVDQRLQAVAAGECGEARRRRMVAAIQAAGHDGGEVAPDQSEHRVVDQQRIEPRERAAAGGADIAFEDAVHRDRVMAAPRARAQSEATRGSDRPHPRGRPIAAQRPRRRGPRPGGSGSSSICPRAARSAARSRRCPSA